MCLSTFQQARASVTEPLSCRGYAKALAPSRISLTAMIPQ